MNFDFYPNRGEEGDDIIVDKDYNELKIRLVPGSTINTGEPATFLTNITIKKNTIKKVPDINLHVTTRCDELGINIKDDKFDDSDLGLILGFLTKLSEMIDSNKCDKNQKKTAMEKVRFRQSNKKMY